MKALSIFAVVAALWLSAIAAPAQVPYSARDVVLASDFDLDGEGLDADQVVAVATFADSTTFTILAQPDVCRLINATVVDADASISAGILTVVGTDCWGAPLTVTYLATGGSGTRTGTVIATGPGVIKASGAYFATVTSVISGVLTGEGGAGDTLTVGVLAQARSWPMYGRQTTSPGGKRWVDVFGMYDVPVLVKNGAATTDVTAVSASTTAPFENVSVGDMLVFNVSGEMFARRVATRADADTITVADAVTLPTAGVNFSYRKLYYLADPQDGWMPVKGYDYFSCVIQTDANVSTGGVISSVECAALVANVFGVPDGLFEEDTNTVATGATGTRTVGIDLRTSPHYTHCRCSVRFGTTDDADSAVEDIDIIAGFRQ